MRNDPMHVNPLSKAVRSALFGGAAIAMAVPSVPSFAADDTLEEVVVTGSRIKRDGFDTVSPVVVTTAEDIKISGQTRIEDLLNQLPQIEVAQNAFIANGASGTAQVDLRGLGPNRTLVLVNGRRLQPGNLNSNAADLNQIPASLVERVEVLTGGASATYGADAVAGVVNFIMKSDFEGVEINLGASAYQHDNSNSYVQGLLDNRSFTYPNGDSGLDGKAYNYDIAVGGFFDEGRGHAVGYVTYRKNEELRQAARDYSSCALNGAGTSCGGSANAIIPNFIIGTTTFSDYDYWVLDSGGNGFDTTTFNPSPYNYAPVNHFMRPDSRYTFGTFIDYEINDNFKPYLESSFMNDVTRAQIAESGTFFNTLYEIPLSSSLISPLQQSQIATRFGLNPATDSFGVYIGKRNVEGGPRTDKLASDAFRFVIGSEGTLVGDWTYNASIQYGSTSSSSTYINDFNDAKIKVALDDALCAADSSCLPYQVFTLNGITPAAASYVTGTGIIKGQTREEIYNVYATGPVATLPSASAPVEVVIGYENRTESFSTDADTIYAEGLLLGQGGATPSVSGSYEVDEVFAEARVPVLDMLSFDLAYRYSDYDLFGGKSTYKVGFELAPTDMVRFRGGYNRAVRVPNVLELFTPTSDGLWNGTDPCSGAAPKLTAAQCANTGVTAAQYGTITASPASQYNAIYGGNANLEPETADTITFGVVVNPMDNLTFSIDYWDIEIEDVINNIGGELLTEQCGYTGDPVFCSTITRSATGSLWLGKTGRVVDTNVNQGSQKWTGIDIAVSYNAEVMGGNLLVTLQGTSMDKKTTEPVAITNAAAAEAAYDCTGVISTDCVATPDWRSTLSATMDFGGPVSANVKWRMMGKVDYDGATDTLAQANLGNQNYFDVSGAYQLNENIAFLLGVNNILDEEPPMVGSTLTSNANVPNGNYDVLGRYWFTSVELKF